MTTSYICQIIYADTLSVVACAVRSDCTVHWNIKLQVQQVSIQWDLKPMNESSFLHFWFPLLKAIGISIGHFNACFYDLKYAKYPSPREKVCVKHGSRKQVA